MEFAEKGGTDATNADFLFNVSQFMEAFIQNEKSQSFLNEQGVAYAIKCGQISSIELLQGSIRPKSFSKCARPGITTYRT
jgi:hypothetical protein